MPHHVIEIRCLDCKRQREVSKDDQREMLRELLRVTPAILSDREKAILEARYGFESGVKHNLEQVGKHFDVTRERVRQLEEKIMSKLAAYDFMLKR